MYARRFKFISQKGHSPFRQDLFGSHGYEYSRSSPSIQYCFLNSRSPKTSFCRHYKAHENTHFHRNFQRDLLLPSSIPTGSSCLLASALRWTCPIRLYSSEGDGRNASEGKHVPVKDADNFDKKVGDCANGHPAGKVQHGDLKVKTSARYCEDHARMGEQDQKEWLNNEMLFSTIRKKESPFLSKREKFKNEFLRRLVPWEKITVSWENFPYHIQGHTKDMLVECAASHLKQHKFNSHYGAHLSSSGGRIMLQSVPGTELYRERLVRALARDLQVPLLVLDSSILAPHDFGRECASETDDETTESGEDTSESEAEDDNDASNEEDWASNSEVKSGSSDEDDVDLQASVEALKKLVPYTLEDFEKRVSGLGSGDASTSEKSDAVESPQPSKQPLKFGDRVKYVGDSVLIDINRIFLGKIPTSHGPTNAYTFINGRHLTSGQRGVVYEVNGDQVAVILDDTCNKTKKEQKDAKAKDEQKDEGVTEATKPSIYWISIRDIEHDLDTPSEDWYIAVEALCEILQSQQPVVVYFSDFSQWLSMAVTKSSREAFFVKLAAMVAQLSGPVVLICGHNTVETGPKEKDKFTMLFPHIDRIGRLSLPLRRLTERLKATKTYKENEFYVLFPNVLTLYPPKEEELLRTFNKQIEEDRRIIIARSNISELRKVLEEHDLLCLDLLHIRIEDVILTKQKAEKVVGWARNHYLSTCILPCIKSERLTVPRESLEIAVSRLREQESVTRKPSQSLKSLAKDEYESNFVSAVVPPDEIGVKFNDIGALEDVKRTLNELVTLPMRRPELFCHGNLLRPCKGILLFGPPGTGKTLLAKALATEAGANFISITGSTLTSKWFGDAEKLTKALFSFATRLAPAIIFVDEVDSILGARGGAFEHEATRRMRNEFMAAWDGLRSKDTQRILILGATNRPFDLDDAVIRRLPRRIYVDLPDAENRMKILRIFLAQENLDAGFRFDELANVTEGYSGSDLKNLCIAAAYRPVQELLEEEKKGGGNSLAPILRSLNLDDFILAKAKVGASIAYDATSMNQLRKWNEQYGEGGSRSRSPFGFN